MSEDAHKSPEPEYPYESLPDPAEKRIAVFELTEETGVFAGILTYCEITQEDLLVLYKKPEMILSRAGITKEEAICMCFKSLTGRVSERLIKRFVDNQFEWNDVKDLMSGQWIEKNFLRPMRDKIYSETE
ncbi:MAG: hypothetical protein WCT16_03125 [Candidatus Buchananbacteria bacterium]